MRSLLFLSAAAMVGSATTLTINPPVISNCTFGLGVAAITWSGAVGTPQIRVGQPGGSAMTGALGASGSATTGLWVSDGLGFYLVDQSGIVEASATAQVKCGSMPLAIDQGLGGGSYFPLAVGNTWVYKYNSRVVTASYVVHAITGQQFIAGQFYYVLTLTSPGPPIDIALLRADSNGVIYQYLNGAEQVYLDPASAGATNYAGPLGVFNDAIAPPAVVSGGLSRTTNNYARGIGLVSSQSQSLTGSSGGFTDGLDLVDVKIDGFHLSAPASKIALSIDNGSPDLTHQQAPNCAIPCYFAACGQGPAVDPPGTYRPCGQIRIDTSTATPGYSVLVEVLDSTGQAVFQTSIQETAAASLEYVRLPLYTGQTPFALLPPGNYTLTGSMVQGNNAVASSTIKVQIQ